MRLRVLTWNLCGIDPRRVDERTCAAIEEILRTRAEVVLLQEVTRRTWHAHIHPHLSHAGFGSATEVPTTDDGYRCAILAKQPIRLTEASRCAFAGSGMDRGLLRVRATWGDTEVLLLTAHLESGAAAAHERQVQLGEVIEALAEANMPAVFAGDTNLRLSDTRAVPTLDQVQDAWEQCGQPQAGRYTWDTKRCPNLRRDGTPRRLRFDRVLMNHHPGWRAREILEVGASEIRGDRLWPSDHTGLLVTLELD